MPLTFPSHQALVLPLKARWPKHFDGLALVLGSVAPDLSYAFLPGTRIEAHNFTALVTWTLPLSLGLLAIVRHVIVPELASLHGFFLPLHAVRTEVSTLRKSAFCAWLGGASHILWDGISKPEGSFPNRFSLLRDTAYEHTPWDHRFFLLSTASSVLGAFVTLYAGRALWKRAQANEAKRKATEGILANVSTACSSTRNARARLFVTMLLTSATLFGSLPLGLDCAAMRAVWVLLAMMTAQRLLQSAAQSR
jgi:hypothetical protein